MFFASYANHSSFPVDGIRIAMQAFRMGKSEESPNRRTLQAQATKQALFDAAIRLFREKGFEAVTIGEIAGEAGTAKGNFYNHFASKGDILAAEFSAIDDFYRRYARNLRRYVGAPARLLAFTRAQTRYVRDKVGVRTLKLLYANTIMDASTRKVLVDPSRYLHELVLGIILDGQSEGSIRPDIEAERLALFYNRAFRSVFLDWAISDAGFDLIGEGLEFCRVMVLPALQAGSQSAVKS
jgi:AcrR family transcriptional regulator